MSGWIIEERDCQGLPNGKAVIAYKSPEDLVEHPEKTRVQCYCKGEGKGCTSSAIEGDCVYKRKFK